MRAVRVGERCDRRVEQRLEGVLAGSDLSLERLPRQLVEVRVRNRVRADLNSRQARKRSDLRRREHALGVDRSGRDVYARAHPSAHELQHRLVGTRVTVVEGHDDRVPLERAFPAQTFRQLAERQRGPTRGRECVDVLAKLIRGGRPPLGALAWHTLNIVVQDHRDLLGCEPTPEHASC